MTDLKYKPDRVSPPGSTLLNILAEKRWDHEDFRYKSGLSFEDFHRLMDGTVIINDALAFKLALLTETETGFWITREKNYRNSLKG